MSHDLLETICILTKCSAKVVLGSGMQRFLQGRQPFKTVRLAHIDVKAMVQAGSESALQAMLSALL